MDDLNQSVPTIAPPSYSEGESAPVELDSAQLEAVQLTEGPVLVIAGPGTGKTRVLTERVRYILEQGYAQPQEILAITFTRKAAQEMRARLTRSLGILAEDINILTFHAFGLQLVKAEAEKLGYLPDSLSVFDASRSRTLVRKALRQLELPEERFPSDSLYQSIARAKERLVESLEEAVPNRGPTADFRAILDTYQNLLLENNAVDFADLIRMPVELLKNDPETLAFYQGRYRYIMVDEFQDTSWAQYQFLRLLAAEHQNLFCVASPAQAIYTWRNADPRIVTQQFNHDFPEATVLTLENNYRSNPNILAVAKSALEGLDHAEKELIPTRPAGTLVRVKGEVTPKHEAREVVRQILSLIPEGYADQDFAVLYRMNAQSRPLEESLIEAGIPYAVVGRRSFLYWREVSDLLAYLRVLHNPKDSVSLERIINRPARGLGERTVERLSVAGQLSLHGLAEQLQAAQLPKNAQERVAEFVKMMDELGHIAEENYPAELIEETVDRSGYRAWLQDDDLAKDRMAHLDQLSRLADRYREGSPREALERFLNDIDLLKQDEPLPWDEEREAVTLSTVHAAKGLEFKAVFLVGMEEGIFPHYRARVRGSTEEERRLFYVAVTRAMDRLTILHSIERELNGSSKRQVRSRFLRDLPERTVEYG